MKVLCLISGRRVPSSRYRVLQYVQHLRARGHVCVVRSAAPAKYQKYGWLGWHVSARLRRGLRHLDLWEARLRGFDVIWLERELFDDPTFDLEERFARTAPLVLDVDDAIFLRYPEKFPALARLAKIILVGNRSLHDAIVRWNPSVRILPTSVDLGDYQVRPPSAASPGRPLVIGWTGTASNLRNLALAAGPLREMARRFDVRLRVICNDDGPLRSISWDPLGVEFLRWNAADQVHRLQQFDVGIMPLEDAEWERHKCGLKALEYMAVGVPALASLVGVNAEIIEHGRNGLLAATEQDWQDGLQSLLQDPALRDRLGASGRRTVAERYSIQANLPALEAALLEASAMR